MSTATFTTEGLFSARPNRTERCVVAEKLARRRRSLQVALETAEGSGRSFEALRPLIMEITTNDRKRVAHFDNCETCRGAF